MMIPSRRVFLKLAGAGASLPVCGLFAQSRGKRIDPTWSRERLLEDTESSLKTMVAANGYLGRMGPAPARQGGPNDQGGQRRGQRRHGHGLADRPRTEHDRLVVRV